MTTSPRVAWFLGLITLGALVLAPVPASAQEHDLSVATDRGDLPDERAPEGLADLAFLIGDWRLETSFALSGGGEFKAEGRLLGRYAMGGFGVLVEEVHSAAANPELEIFVGSQLYSIHPESGDVIGVGCNTLGNRKSRRGGMVDGDLVVIESGELFEGRPGINRMTFFNITEDRFELRLERSLDDGATWEDGGYGFVAIRE